ncbi:hypothetical protein GM418_13165 [Maribellus comscasis]|uniref:Right-handed parallel beta-helix repeat-containing protein n=1 Tax=Maribellus comscasis TaxID=2681766 RepID=A0A6I6JU59_9BACT|nr:hypothetical protein [Maribellus comscasis]QGY44578.1 hypothetical protein GM418_13165 [Maribellus comscasis]
MKKAIHFIFVLLSGALIFSCNEEAITTSPNVKLEFSADTVSFDTVFTTIGSTTKSFRVKNPENNSVNISNIRLAGGDNSPFRLNINGVQTNNGDNFTIYGKDSMYIFVEVTVDPTGQDLPMVIHDSIVFNLNGNTQDVDLIAFGQDFHLFDGKTIKSQHWPNDKPYLIYNSVLVDSMETLTIDAGCRIHFHEGSSLFVHGTLLVNGTADEPVNFLGDRLEETYKNVPGQWGAYTTLSSGSIYVFGGLHFLAGSVNNHINHANIKNAEKGIQVDTLGASDNPVLTLQNSVIENMTLNCLDARTTFVKASNCIFANSGSYTVALRFGGHYEFNHNTIANYYTGSTRTVPALFLNNYYEIDEQTFGFDLDAEFNNCIVYGNVNNEVSYSIAESSPFIVNFNTCLLNTLLNTVENDMVFTNSLFNKDPLFEDPYDYNYAIDSLSPARDIGNSDIANLFPFDLNNNSRLADDGPDLGALEWVAQEEE